MRQHPSLDAYAGRALQSITDYIEQAMRRYALAEADQALIRRWRMRAACDCDAAPEAHFHGHRRIGHLMMINMKDDE